MHISSKAPIYLPAITQSSQIDKSSLPVREVGALPAMAPAEEGLLRALLRDTTFYLCFALLVTAIGPFQFGYHLVRLIPLDNCHLELIMSAGRAECTASGHYM